MTRARLLAVGLLLAAGPLAVRGRPAAAEDAPAPVEARDVEADTTWSGTVRLASRVHVRAGATLRVAPGTRVTVPLDAQRGRAEKPGLEVHGRLVVEGTAAAPVRFEPEAARAGTAGPGPDATPGAPAWAGVMVHPGAGEVRLARAVVVGAETGLQPGRSEVTASGCVFYGCGAGVGVGVLWDGPSRRVAFAREVGPVLEDCRFARCAVGVAVEARARPTLVRCVFLRCRLAVGNERPGITYAVEGLGPDVDRCEVLRCGVGVDGPSRVTHSIFEGNQLVFRGSSFAEHSTVEIERYVRARNLYAGNDALTRSDVPVGDDAVLDAPRRRRPLPDTLGPDELAGDLGAVLGLEPGSPGAGAAAGGGDLGAFGAAATTRPEPVRAPVGTGLAVPRWLWLGPVAPFLPDSLEALAAAAAARPPLAGDAAGEGAWAVLEGADLRDPAAATRLAATVPQARVLLVPVTAAADGRARLVLGWDGVLEAWWNGKPLATRVGPRRYRPDDVVAGLTVRRGVNALLLRHAPRAATGRLAATFLAEAGDGPPPGLACPEVVRAETAPRALAGASVAPEKGRDGKPTGRVVLRAALTGTVHWADAADRRRWILSNAAGATVSLDDAPLQLRPAEKALWFTLPQPLPAGAWRLSLEGARRASGVAFPEPSSVPVR